MQLVFAVNDDVEERQVQRSDACACVDVTISRIEVVTRHQITNSVDSVLQGCHVTSATAASRIDLEEEETNQEVTRAELARQIRKETAVGECLCGR